MQSNATNRSNSQKRARDLRHQSDVIGQTFSTNNFYEGKQINMIKLKEQISIAKRKLLKDRDNQINHLNQFNTQKQIILPYANLALGHERTRSIITRVDRDRIRVTNPDSFKRLATQLGDYEVIKKNAHFREINQRRNDKNQVFRSRKINGDHVSNSSKHQRFPSVDPPSPRNTVSGYSVQIQHQKSILQDQAQVKQFEGKIVLLWQLYQAIVNLMQEVSKSMLINEKLVLLYIQKVTSHNFEFVHYLSQTFADARVKRSIKMSRVLQFFSVFEACLKSVPKKKVGSSEIINYLGYSSSNVIFLIKILLLTHETSFPFTEHVNSIVSSISEFQIKSYKCQLRNNKEVLRRLQHNNEIIGMIKARCGKKHGKICEEFVTKIIRQMDKQKVPFYECARNIFQFLAFYLHFENLAANFQIISTPPSPFLSLKKPKTIIIEPWQVLAYSKNNKLVIRAHCGKFLAQISDNCNLIFWTELMPKDAQILTNLFPAKDNIFWLYRYHCRQENQNMLKIVDLVGCDVENTLIIDNSQEHFSFNKSIGITMSWTGEKKDIKLMPLSKILQEVLVVAQQSNMETEIMKRKSQIDKFSSKKKMNQKPLKL